MGQRLSLFKLKTTFLLTVRAFRIRLPVCRGGNKWELVSLSTRVRIRITLNVFQDVFGIKA
jgi:hypothetical protein